MMNRALSIRSRRSASNSQTDAGNGATASPPSATRHRFNMSSLRARTLGGGGHSRRLHKLIKAEAQAISGYETAARMRAAVATQLSDWGEAGGEAGVSEVSDKLGVVLAELGEQEDGFAARLEDSRAVLKAIRNTEAGTQPSRDARRKVEDDIARLRQKEPESARLPALEQELVRAEAQSLVAEAQLSNVTRAKLKEAYDVHFAATIERAEKQIMLAKHGRRLLNLLDDAPVVPGSPPAEWLGGEQARQILADAEADLRTWTPDLEPIEMRSAGMGANLVPGDDGGHGGDPMAADELVHSPTAAEAGGHGIVGGHGADAVAEPEGKVGARAEAEAV